MNNRDSFLELSSDNHLAGDCHCCEIAGLCLGEIQFAQFEDGGRAEFLAVALPHDLLHVVGKQDFQGLPQFGLDGLLDSGKTKGGHLVLQFGKFIDKLDRNQVGTR